MIRKTGVSGTKVSLGDYIGERYPVPVVPREFFFFFLCMCGQDEPGSQKSLRVTLFRDELIIMED